MKALGYQKALDTRKKHHPLFVLNLPCEDETQTAKQGGRYKSLEKSRNKNVLSDYFVLSST